MLRRIAWEHPGWWVLALAAAVWAVMIHHAIQHGEHAHHHRMTAPEEVLHWLLMVFAMMAPLLWDPVRTVAFRSYRRRRHVAIATFLAGYLAVWLVAGLPVALIRAFAWSHTHGAAAAMFVVAALWSLSRPHAQALVACHGSRPLAPDGWPATRDALAYGMWIGGACVVSCWPLMLACTLTGHSLIAMVGGAAVGALERLSFRPPTRTIALATLGLAAWHVGLALHA